MKPSLVLAGALAVHHRLYAPTLPPVPFTERGSLLPEDGTYRLQPAPSLPDDLAAFADILALPAVDNLYYQLALQRDDQTWDFASVKAVCHYSPGVSLDSPIATGLQCHLPQVTSQTIVLHLQDSNPFAIDYYLSPIPHDGSCPKSKASAAAFTENLQKLNTTVILESPRTLPL
jgi:hypothetical protein